VDWIFYHVFHFVQYNMLLSIKNQQFAHTKYIQEIRATCFGGRTPFSGSNTLNIYVIFTRCYFIQCFRCCSLKTAETCRREDSHIAHRYSVCANCWF
jgi:hypothetical protein